MYVVVYQKKGSKWVHSVLVQLDLALTPQGESRGHASWSSLAVLASILSPAKKQGWQQARNDRQRHCVADHAAKLRLRNSELTPWDEPSRETLEQGDLVCVEETALRCARVASACVASDFVTVTMSISLCAKSSQQPAEMMMGVVKTFVPSAT
jgi:hypothetical protein